MDSEKLKRIFACAVASIAFATSVTETEAMEAGPRTAAAVASVFGTTSPEMQRLAVATAEGNNWTFAEMRPTFDAIMRAGVVDPSVLTVKDIYGHSLLMAAYHFERPDVVKVLLSSKCPVPAKEFVEFLSATPIDDAQKEIVEMVVVAEHITDDGRGGTMTWERLDKEYHKLRASLQGALDKTDELTRYDKLLAQRP